MKVSFAVTAYEETTRNDGPSIRTCIDAALAHPLIDEIVIVDDKSSDYQGLVEMFINKPKVKVFQNEENLGVFGNKLSAVYHSTGDWVITSDSDNIFDHKAIDLVLSSPLDGDTWYCPSFARPNFDYREYVGSYDLSNVGDLLRRGGLANCFVNTGNQTVNRTKFLNVFEKYLNSRADLLMPNYLNLKEEERKLPYWKDVFNACDSLVFNSEWLKAGGTLVILEDFHYDHFWTGGPGSNYNRAPAEKGLLNDLLLNELESLSPGKD